MDYKIEWTENAIQDLEKIVEYLRDKWSVESAEKFVDILGFTGRKEPKETLKFNGFIEFSRFFVYHYSMMNTIDNEQAGQAQSNSDYDSAWKDVIEELF